MLVGLFLRCLLVACEKKFRVVTICIRSLEILHKYVRCPSGHLFCAECAGKCAVKLLQEILTLTYSVNDTEDDGDDFLTVILWIRLKMCHFQLIVT